jgi:hypothetical protein
LDPALGQPPGCCDPGWRSGGWSRRPARGGAETSCLARRVVGGCVASWGLGWVVGRRASGVMFAKTHARTVGVGRRDTRRPKPTACARWGEACRLESRYKLRSLLPGESRPTPTRTRGGEGVIRPGARRLRAQSTLEGPRKDRRLLEPPPKAPKGNVTQQPWGRRQPPKVPQGHDG